MSVNLQDFAPEDLWKIRKAATRVKDTIKCKLCRCSFKPSSTKQEFHSVNCRVRYWQLKKEIGEQELMLRLNYLEDRNGYNFT